MSGNLSPKQELFQESILSFYESEGRTLPWRQTTDPYKVLVSELMLQQTQVPRVIEKFRAFIEKFPTREALASAQLPDVLRLWQGLGYNRRAKYLWEAAQTLSDEPSYEELVATKGIGPYTAAAVCAFAYNQDIAAVDVNIHRIFSRFFGEDNDTMIKHLVPENRSRDWHNALMDFGSLTCTKRNPSCDTCPLASKCHALAHNTFSEEKSASQGTFLGTNRWHRGQILKQYLAGERNVQSIRDSLSKHFDAKTFDKALQGLIDDGLVEKDQLK